MEFKVKIDKKDLKWLDLSHRFIETGVEKGMRDVALLAERKAKMDFTKSRTSDGPLHVRTGNLRRSIVGEAKGSIVSLGSDVIYSRIHELGGMAGPNKDIRIPKRPYLKPAFEENMDEIEKTIVDALIKSWETQ